MLHDLFDVPFDEVSRIVDRTPAAARQLASRARRRVQGSTVPDTNRTRHREVVRAFLAASRAGDFDALLAVLDPDIVLRADRAAVQMGAEKEVHGAVAVAQTFAGRAQAAQPALVNGVVALVWARRREPQVVFGLTIVGGKIVQVDLVADPDRLGQLDLALLDE